MFDSFSPITACTCMFWSVLWLLLFGLPFPSCYTCNVPLFLASTFFLFLFLQCYSCVLIHVLFSISIFSRVMSKSLLWSWVLEMKPRWVDFDTWIITDRITCINQTLFLIRFYNLSTLSEWKLNVHHINVSDVRTWNWTTSKDDSET